MPLSQFCRETSDQVCTFKLIHPILKCCSCLVCGKDCTGNRARRSQIFHGCCTESCKAFVAVNTEEVKVFVRENDGRHAIPATDFDLIGEINMLVAIDVSDMDSWAYFGNRIDHRHLMNTVAAPRAGNHDNIDVPHK